LLDPFSFLFRFAPVLGLLGSSVPAIRTKMLPCVADMLLGFPSGLFRKSETGYPIRDRETLVCCHLKRLETDIAAEHKDTRGGSVYSH
jgi:hypothetical protein